MRKTESKVAAGAQGRFAEVDTLKGAGILLVIFGHLLEHPVSETPLVHDLHTAIYSFHMPLFVFLSGIFAKEVLSRTDYRKIIWSLFVPLVVFQIVYMGVGQWADWGTYPPFAPYWLLWFIASLIVWRLVLPLVASPIGLCVAILGAVLAGFDHSVGYALSASRTLYFLPFFILGHLYGKPLIAAAGRNRPTFILIFVAAMAIVVFWRWNGLDPAALTGSHDYDGAPPAPIFPGVARLVVMTLGLAGLIGFSALIPARSRALEWLGQRSLAIYLLHGLVVMVFVASGGMSLIPAAAQIPAMAALAVLIAVLTAAGDLPMRRFFRPPDEAPQRKRAAAYGPPDRGQMSRSHRL